MRVRKLERNAKRLGLPDDEAIREHALRGDFRRALLAVRIEDRGEQHRVRPYRCRVRLQALALQVGERRHEIEIPVGDHRSVARRRAPRGDRAATTRAARRRRACPTTAISSSVRRQPTQRPVDVIHPADADARRRNRTFDTAGMLTCRPRDGADGASRVSRRRDRASSARATRDIGSAAADSRRCSGPRDAASSCRRRSRCRVRRADTRRLRSRRCRSRPSHTGSRRAGHRAVERRDAELERRVDVRERLAVRVVEMTGKRGTGTRSATRRSSACVLPAVPVPIVSPSETS